MAKSKKPKYNNNFKVPNEKADEIRRLNNQQLVGKAALEYSNWIYVEHQKKEDEKIVALKNQIKDMMDDLKSDAAYIELEEEFKRKKEELETEELAQFKEELKNELQPINEEIKLFKGLFQLCMEEIANRKSRGSLKIEELPL